MVRTIDWAMNNQEKWDIVYLGCICVNPTVPVLMEGNLIMHKSAKGHLTGHSFMFNICVAQRYLKNKNHIYTFDQWLAQESFRTYMSQLTVFTQLSFDAPGYMKRTIGMNIDARIALDIAVLGWMCVWITLFFILNTIIFTSVLVTREKPAIP